jgi:hypothetical protein
MRVAITGWSLFSKWLKRQHGDNTPLKARVESAKLKTHAAPFRVRRTSLQNVSLQYFFNAGNALAPLVAKRVLPPINTTSCGKLL